MMLAFYLFGPYWWLALPGLMVGLYAQIRLSGTYARYAREPVASGLSGAEAARRILDRAGLHEVPVTAVPGELTDHYDPLKQALFLSQANYHSRSIAAVGVAAHEAGHALQHQAAYAPLQWRMMLVPATNFVSRAFYLILGVGFLLTMMGLLSPVLFAKILPIAIGAYAVVTLFQLVTLPVEYDASRRAKERLAALGIIRGPEHEAIRSVLNAAALTYVAALVTAVLELLRLVMIARSLDDRS